MDLVTIKKKIAFRRAIRECSTKAQKQNVNGIKIKFQAV
jgi:ribosomal protein S3